MIDKITGDVCCFRAASHITKENHSTESGVARFVWENNQLFMSFDSSNGTGYKTPIRKSTFINNSFVVKSNNSTYSGFSSEKTGLWKSNTGEPCIGFFSGWLWKSSVLPELFLNESTLEVCRSFLSLWKDENGNYKWEGRFNQGVVSLNLPQIAILSRGDEMKFWALLDERLALCFEALMERHKRLLSTLSDVSPIHWQYGGISRLKKGEKIDKLLKGGYSTLSLGYIGIYETTKLMMGVSHTDPEKGLPFALKVMNYLRTTCDKWKEATGLGFGLYGTPAESLCYRFARIDKARFGIIEDVTDKGYYTNSYHVDVREKIDAFSKLKFESQFQTISSGGAISYVEIPNMQHNLEALEDLVRYIYDNIQYAEFNTKSDFCLTCGYDGEIKLDDDNRWFCPNCGERRRDYLNVTRRTCGYLGENFWNVGKTKEIKSRVLHL